MIVCDDDGDNSIAETNRILSFRAFRAASLHVIWGEGSQGDCH